MPLILIIVLAVILFIVISLIAGFFVATRIIFKEAYVNKEKNDLNKSKFLMGEQYIPYQDKIQRNIEECASLPFEKVSIKSYDGLNLYGQVYRFNDSNKVQIQVHGFKGSGRRDMCGFLLNAKENGLNCLVIDQRAHGHSDGNICTFGVKERKDLIKWIDFAKQTFGEDIQIVLRGLSMGAATVLMVLDQELPPNVKCVIADCPFSAPIDELVDVALKEKTKLPKGAATFMLKCAAKIHAHFNTEESAPYRAVKNAKVPILLFHGTDDRFVPFWMAEKTYNGNPNMIRFEKFEGAGHALCYFSNPDRYLKVTKDFIDQNIK